MGCRLCECESLSESMRALFLWFAFEGCREVGSEYDRRLYCEEEDEV